MLVDCYLVVKTFFLYVKRRNSLRLAPEAVFGKSSFINFFIPPLHFRQPQPFNNTFLTQHMITDNRENQR